MEIESAPIVNIEYFLENRAKLKKIIIAGGGFDILHLGHIEHLREAKSLGGILVVHITGDQRIREKKGIGRPIFPAEERAKIISSLRFVDYVFIHDGRHYEKKIIDLIKPDIIFFNAESYTAEAEESLKNFNFLGKVFISKKEKINSSSSIITNILTVF